MIPNDPWCTPRPGACRSRAGGTTVLTTARPHLDLVRREPGGLTEGELAGRVYQQARCAVSRIDPDQWFPVAMDVARARDQAADAIAVCAACPVRADCL